MSRKARTASTTSSGWVWCAACRAPGMTMTRPSIRRASSARVAAATIVRELGAESAGAGNLDALGEVRQPVLQLLGGGSLPSFASATRALDARLVDGRVVVIPGARHAAHHTHPADVVRAVRAFLDM